MGLTEREITQFSRVEGATAEREVKWCFQELKEERRETPSVER